MIGAFGWGALGASALALGAVIAYRLAPGRHAIANVMAIGTGVLIGDGALNYRKEDVLETYYAISLHKESTLTFDYQFIADPAYNADRGPVSVFTGRFHAEF